MKLSPENSIDFKQLLNTLDTVPRPKAALYIITHDITCESAYMHVSSQVLLMTSTLYDQYILSVKSRVIRSPIDRASL